MNREAIMTALFSLIMSGITTNLTGDLTATSAVVQNPSSLAGLFLGLPVFGAGIPRGAVVSAIGSSDFTLSQPASASGASIAMTTGVLTSGRRLLLWSKVSAFPALFLRDGPEDWPPHNEMVFPKIVLEPQIWIYSKAGENWDFAPSVALNNFLDAIQSVLSPKTGPDRSVQLLTIGSLVSRCWIEGTVLKEPGDLDSIAKALIPLKIIVSQKRPF